MHFHLFADIEKASHGVPSAYLTALARIFTFLDTFGCINIGLVSPPPPNYSYSQARQVYSDNWGWHLWPSCGVTSTTPWLQVTNS